MTHADASADGLRDPPWTAASVLGDGWRAIKTDPSLVLVMLLVIVVGNAIDIAFSLAGEAMGGDEGALVSVAGTLLNLPLQAFVTVGWVRYLLAAMRGETPRIGVLLSGGRTLAMLGMMFVYAIAVSLGLLLLIVPGVMLICGWWVAGMALVDRERGPIECLGHSWALTDGLKWEILLLAIFEFLLALGGLLCCLVGVVPALAICATANAALYLRLVGERPALGARAHPV